MTGVTEPSWHFVNESGLLKKLYKYFVICQEMQEVDLYVKYQGKSKSQIKQ